MNTPELIILCGPPGCGKTSFAKKLLNDSYYQTNIIHLSSDAIRAELWGNEAIQGDNNQVFNLMRIRAVEALNNGKSVIYDCTSMTRKDRAPIIAACPKFAQIRCYVVWAPIEVCIERDAARERTVGKEVIDRMLKRFQPVWFDEGIHEIKIVLPDNFDELKYTNQVAESMKISHDNPHHTFNIYEHCIKAYEYAHKMDYGNDLEFAAMWHDVGKPYVKSFVDSNGSLCEIAHFYSHQNLSSYICYGINNSTPFRAWLIGAHMDPFLNTKYYHNLPAYLKAEVDLLHEADLAAH